jgi:hypothetical protein
MLLQVRSRWSVLLTFQKINELEATLKEPLSAAFICMLSNTGGNHHDENSSSDGCYSRIRGTCIRSGQN